MCGTFFKDERRVRFIRPHQLDHIIVSLDSSDEEEDESDGEVFGEIQHEEFEDEGEHDTDCACGDDEEDEEEEEHGIGCACGDDEEDEDGEEEEHDTDCECGHDTFILESEDDILEVDDDVTEMQSSSQGISGSDWQQSQSEVERYEVIGNQLVPIRDMRHSNYNTDSENSGPLQKRFRTSTPNPDASRHDHLFSEEAENNYESERTETGFNLPGKSIFIKNSPSPIPNIISTHSVERQLEDVEKTILVELPEAPLFNVELNPETVNSAISQHFPTSLGNDGDQSSSGRIPPNSEIEDVIVIDKPEGAGSQPLSQPTASGQVQVPKIFIAIKPNLDVVVRTENGKKIHTQVVRSPFLLDNRTGQSISCVFVPSMNELGPGTRQSTSRTTNSTSDANLETLTLTEGLDMTPTPHSSSENPSSPLEDSNPTHSQTGLGFNLQEGNGAGTSTIPDNGEHDYSRASASSSCPEGSNLVYLGDPRRNILIDSRHLTAAQQKSDPKQAICYLVGNLFSKELKICNVADFRYYQSFDQNKMAAIREYVATLFPQYDIDKCGKDCDSYIFYAKCLMAFATASDTEGTPQNNPGSSVDTTTVSSSEAVRENRHHYVESRSQIPQPENPSGQKNASVVFEDKDEVTIQVLDYFGNPHRNVLLPVDVMTVAKDMAHPEQSAKYLIRELFSDDDLMRSNVYGHMRLGLTPLSANKISALREFLQEHFPAYHLLEDGCDWHFCVSAINSFLYNLRNNSGNASFGNNMTEDN